jgi:hypothetical protein
MNSSGTVPQTIKIQAIQTNPQTGVKQIVAIPIQVIIKYSKQTLFVLKKLLWKLKDAFKSIYLICPFNS